MAKINSIVFCLEIDRKYEENDLVSAKGILPNIIINNFPNCFSFSLIIFLDNCNPEIKNKVRVKFKAPEPNEKILADTDTIELKANKNLANLPEDYHGIGISLDFKNIDFEQEGIYKVEVYVNDDLVGDKTIKVLKGIDFDE